MYELLPQSRCATIGHLKPVPCREHQAYFPDRREGHPCTMRSWTLVHSYLMSWPARLRGCMRYSLGLQGREALVILDRRMPSTPSRWPSHEAAFASAFPALFFSVTPVPPQVYHSLVCCKLSLITPLCAVPKSPFTPFGLSHCTFVFELVSTQ